MKKYIVTVKKPIKGSVVWAGPGNAADVKGHDMEQFTKNKDAVKSFLDDLVLKKSKPTKDGSDAVPDSARRVHWNAQKGGFEVELEDDQLGTVVNHPAVRGVVDA